MYNTIMHICLINCCNACRDKKAAGQKPTMTGCFLIMTQCHCCQKKNFCAQNTQNISEAGESYNEQKCGEREGEAS